MKLEFSIVQLNDLEIVEDLAKEIWNDRYTEMISQAQIDYMLEKFQSVAAIQQQQADDYAYYIIKFNGQAIGYFAIQPREGHLFLSKLYLKSEVKGRGFGQKTFDKIVELAKTTHLSSIQLTVNKTNPAYNIYLKWGFVVVDKIVADIGGGFVMDDYVLEYQIKDLL